MTLENIARDYIQIWNEREPSRRRAQIANLFAEDCSYADPLAVVRGRDGIDGLIAAVQSQLVGVAFALSGAVDAHHDVARFVWHAGVSEGEPLVIGFDVMVTEGGKIRQIVGFLDKAPAQ